MCVNYSDGGGKVLAALRPVVGIDAGMCLWLSLTHKAPADLSITFEEVISLRLLEKISWKAIVATLLRRLSRIR